MHNLALEGKGVLNGAEAFDVGAFNLIAHPIDTPIAIVKGLEAINDGVIDNVNQAISKNLLGYDYKIPDSSKAFACHLENAIANFGYEDLGAFGFNVLAGGAIGDFAELGAIGDSAELPQAAETIANPVPATLARVIPNGIDATTLGAPGAADVFVADAAQLEGLNAQQIAAILAIPESPTGFQVIQFATPEEGLATPILRTNPGFIGGGQTAGGASEFVIPNGPIPSGATITVVH